MCLRSRMGADCMLKSSRRGAKAPSVQLSPVLLSNFTPVQHRLLRLIAGQRWTVTPPDLPEHTINLRPLSPACSFGEILDRHECRHLPDDRRPVD